MRSRSRNQSDGDGGAVVALFVVAMLWWLRWVILAALITAGLVCGVVWALRWFLRRQARRRSAEIARVSALRQRAEIQNAQVLRGDPHGFFGQSPLPDPELIPRWYSAGWRRRPEPYR